MALGWITACCTSAIQELVVELSILITLTCVHLKFRFNLVAHGLHPDSAFLARRGLIDFPGGELSLGRGEDCIRMVLPECYPDLAHQPPSPPSRGTPAYFQACRRPYGDATNTPKTRGSSAAAELVVPDTPSPGRFCDAGAYVGRRQHQQCRVLVPFGNI